MGKRGWLNELLEQEYLPAIAQLEDSRSGRAKAQELAGVIREGWVERGAKTLEQQQSLMDQTRRAIKDRFGKEHFSLEYIGFSREENFQLNHLKQLSARKRQLHQQYLKDPDAIVSMALRLLESPEWAEVAAGLAVLTGRRLNEVLKTAEFTVKSEWVVTFRGALKRKGEDVPLVFDIPTLTTAQRVVEATEKLRGITPADANESKVSEVSDRFFAELVPAPFEKASLYTHLWRSVFCCIATFWYCPKHVDDLLFKAHIMGHFETLTNQELGDEQKKRQRLETFNSERHYRLYEIDDQLIAQYKGQRKGVKLAMAGIEPLEVFQVGMPQHQPTAKERFHRSSLRIWQEDRDRLAAILKLFEGKTQPDRMAAWMEWTQRQLQQSPMIEQSQAGASGKEENTADGASSATIVVPNNATDGETAAIGVEEVDPIQSAQSITNSIAPTGVSGLEAKLDQLLDVMAQFVQAQMPSPSTRRNPTAIAKPLAAITPKLSPLATAPAQAVGEGLQPVEPKPRKYKTGEADTIINRAIDAIMQHNNQPDRPHDLKWAITINGLKSFSSNQRAIERILQHRREEVEQHHQHHQLQGRHNDRHKRKRKITDVIVI